MTVFAKNTMNVTQCSAVQDRVGTLQMSILAPHDLMMFSVDTGDRQQQDIYHGLPSEALLSAFPGFTKIDRENLPDFLSTLVVREDGFKERFPDIYQKRRSKIG